MASPRSLPSLDEGHELLCVEGAVRVGGDVLGRDPQGLGEAHELSALVVEACDFHDSFLAVAFDIAVEEASSQASATQEPILVTLRADRCGGADTPLTVAPGPLAAACTAGHRGPGPRQPPYTARLRRPLWRLPPPGAPTW